MHRPSPTTQRFTALLILLVALIGVGGMPAAHAADRGTGFGTWAPLSRNGWHGSMRVGNVHTYCIHPGLPVATGTTTDRGISTDARGLSPQQLTSINYLVGTYGQTDDVVQAASVGWAVKAIVDRDTTLHSWGYGGDDLAGAIDYILRRASPENNSAVQARTTQYLAEAEAVPVARVGGSLTLSTREDDPTRGALAVDVDPTATGVLRLENAVFADTGSTERTDVRGGATYPIIAPASASDGGRPYRVRASGSFTVRSAAIRYYTTADQQESAGPADPTTFDLSTEDASSRPVVFSPRIETTARIDTEDRFVDQVTVLAPDGMWPRHDDGSYVVITASADVYRTRSFPAESDEIPSYLSPVARLDLRTDPAVGAGTYEVSTDELPGPGVYTAVWRIERTSQDADSLAHLPARYFWMERFASPSQTEQLVAVVPPRSPKPTPTPTATPVPVIAVDPPAAVAQMLTVQPVAAALALTGSPAASLTGVGGAAVLAIGLGVMARRYTRVRTRPRS